RRHVLKTMHHGAGGMNGGLGEVFGRGGGVDLTPEDRKQIGHGWVLLSLSSQDSKRFGGRKNALSLIEPGVVARFRLVGSRQGVGGQSGDSLAEVKQGKGEASQQQVGNV